MIRYLLLLLVSCAAYGADPQLGLGPAPVTTAAPSGAAGGDLGGTYPNPTVVSVADITTGVLPAANGGTGVNNAGTLTLATSATITGGGTLALGGFTLTVPATGTAAILGVANTFTASSQTLSPAAGSASLIIQAATGSVSQVLFKNNGSNISSIQESPTNPYTFNDAVNSVNTLVYTAGTASTGFWTHNNTTASTSTGTGCLVLLGGLGVAGQISVATGNLDVTTSTANGSVASVLAASTGPTGASTTETGWITIKVAGTNHYIPYW